MDKIVYPNYENNILNLINSILKYYNVETKYKGLPKVNEILKKEYKNIVLIILDGMGNEILKKISPNGFFSKNKLDVISSVFPSTTTAAITTYYSGKPPIETGWIAMSQYFKEYGRTIEMLRKKDSYTGEEYKDTIVDVFDLVKYTPIYEQIENASSDVKAYEINPKYCEARSKRNINVNNIELMCESIKSVCQNKEKNFILAYSDNPDVLLHKNGTNSNKISEFLINAENEIEKLCKEIEENNTLVIISADHGHKNIEKTYNILDLKEIEEYLIMPPTLESRVVSFWIKEDKKKEFEDYCKYKFEKEFKLYTKEELLKDNLLGFGNKHPKIDDFIGNYILISIGGSIIKLGTNISKEKEKKISTHCGLTQEEMEVPLIIIE